METTRSIDIDAPPATVWRILSDIAAWPSWTDSIRGIRVLDEGELRPGLRARVGIRGGPEGEWTVTAVDEGRSFDWTNAAPGVKSLATHVIEPRGDGARVTLAVKQTGPGAVILGPYLKRVSNRNLEVEIAGLKRASEAAIRA